MTFILKINHCTYYFPPHDDISGYGDMIAFQIERGFKEEMVFETFFSK